MRIKLMVQDGDIWDVREDGAPGVPLFRADYAYRRWGREVPRQQKEDVAHELVRLWNGEADA